MNARAADNLANIGEVLAELKAEFPDVTVSKIRFLEAEELVMPMRTSSGYRKFSHADMERLRYILRAQRDRYLPLKVIREELDALDRGLQPTKEGKPRAPRSLVSVDSSESGEIVALRLTKEELLEASGVTATALRTLEQYGLVEADSRGFYGRSGLSVCMLAFELQAYGVEPRHLRTFKVSADREASLVTAVVTPYTSQRSPEHQAQGEEMARAMTSLAGQLHSELLRDAVTRSVSS